MQQLRPSLRFSLSTLREEQRSPSRSCGTHQAGHEGHSCSLGCDALHYTCSRYPYAQRGRCLCIGPGVKAVRPANIEKASIMYPSNNCDRVEVIITLKHHRGQRCLDPRSKQAYLIRQHYEKKNFLKHRNI